MTELPTRRRNVPPSAGADVAVHPVLTQDVLEMVDRVPAWAFKGQSLDLVVPDQVDIGAEFLDNRCKFFRVLGLIVYPRKQDVLERDLPTGLLEPGCARGDELIDRGELGPRDKLAPQIVVGRVQRKRERHGELELVREFLDGLVHPDRGNGDLAGADPHAPRCRDRPRRMNHSLEVREGLAHAHKDDVGDPTHALKLIETPDLLDDPTRGEVPVEPADPRGAELAPDGAPDLGTDARCASLRVNCGDHDALGLSFRIGIRHLLIEDRQARVVLDGRFARIDLGGFDIVRPLDEEFLRPVRRELMRNSWAGQEGHLFGKKLPILPR